MNEDDFQTVYGLAVKEDHRMHFRRPDDPLTPEQMHVRKQVYEQITDAPSTFNMMDWESTAEDLTATNTLNSGCSTTRCLGGWAQYFYRGYVSTTTVEDDAVEAMGLSWADYYGPAHRGRLFFLPAADAVEQMRILAGE